MALASMHGHEYFHEKSLLLLDTCRQLSSVVEKNTLYVDNFEKKKLIRGN